MLGYGFFTDKLPPIFTSETFFQYCKTNNPSFDGKAQNYIHFESIRNTSVPRSLGIPVPMKYESLCRILRDNWDNIRDCLRQNTMGQPYKISRIHIRKLNNQKYLFQMNYNNWKTDDDPLPEILIGKKYLVSADISTCFPSIYTHSLCWAMVGKEVAKSNRRSGVWFNDIDHACQQMRNGETHGLMIGPHASNLLAELILTKVDKSLSDKGYQFIRNIDDYTCVTETNEDAQTFITDLAKELRIYDLSLNHKKTKIETLPMAAVENWVRVLNGTPTVGKHGIVDYKTARAYLDTAVKLMQDNGGNAATLYYAIKVLSKNKISNNAKQYCVRTAMHLAIIYPYLVPLLDKYVFTVFNAKIDEIESFSQMLFDDSKKNGNCEGMSFAFYFAVKYGFQIAYDIADIISQDDCLLKTMALVYARKNSITSDLTDLEKEAQRLKAQEFDENWLFIYECLKPSQLSGDWKVIKNSNISFLQPI